MSALEIESIGTGTSNMIKEQYEKHERFEGEFFFFSLALHLQKQEGADEKR